METLCTCIFDFFREKHTCRMEDLCLGSSYFYPSLKRSDDNKERYRKYIGKQSLWEYEDVMIPVNLPREKHWVLVVISVVNLCIYIYDSVCSSPSTYRTIFDHYQEQVHQARTPIFIFGRTRTFSGRQLGRRNPQVS